MPEIGFDGEVIIERTTTVAASATKVWARVVTEAGINDEMRPWMTMRPPGGRQLTVDTVPVGEPIGRCWLRLFGVVPFDYDALTIVAVEPGRRFHEKSTMLSMRRWEHERTVDHAGCEASTVHDRVTFEPRLPMLSPLVAPIVRAFFAHRHRRLIRHFDR